MGKFFVRAASDSTESNQNRAIVRKAISYQMAEPEIELKPAVPVTAASDASVATKTPSQTPDTNGATGPPDRAAHDASTKGATSSVPPPYLAEALNDAERLLKYAAETGTNIDDDIRNYILRARAASSNGWNEETAANLLTALTNLAARVKPVTAESLKSCCDDTRPTVRTYLWVAVCLAFIIVPFSVVSFVGSAISSAIRADIDTANDLAVKLRVQLGPPPAVTQAAAASTASAASAPASSTPTPPPSAPPPGLNANDVITELQQFASTIRAIDARARQLNVLVLHTERDPFAQLRKDPTAIHKKFQLPEGLPDLAQAANERTTVFQDVRYFAQNLLDDVSFYYGAITTCILPVLYALLGTCAYLLRSFEQQMSTRTFIPSEVNFARFLIAGIGGAVVGLFNNFSITQGASIPPLAIAFLVGYAVDVFFAFLEGLLQAFTKSSPGSPLPPAGAKS
jgi:hypothetical protein